MIELVPFQPTPFWMLVHWDASRGDITAAERKAAEDVGVTDFDDAGVGLCFNNRDDADKVAVQLAKALCAPIGVYGSQDGEIRVALPPPLRAFNVDEDTAAVALALGRRPA